MTRMLFWCGLAVVVGWFLLPASLESLSVALGSLSVALGSLAAELKVLPLPVGDALKLVGGMALLAAMWRWTTPESERRSNSRRSPYRRKLERA